MAIDHCVFFKRSNDVTDAQVDEVMALLASITQRLEGASDFRASRNESPEGFDAGYLDGFIVRFANANARDIYLVDEDHQRAGAQLVGLCEGGTDGLLVFDLAV